MQKLKLKIEYERIVEEEQNGKERAEYGEEIINNLSTQLTHAYGKGFSSRYLRSFRRFYLLIDDYEIWKSRFPNLIVINKKIKPTKGTKVP